MSLCKCENCGKRLHDDEDHECYEDDVRNHEDYEAGRADWESDREYARDNP